MLNLERHSSVFHCHTIVHDFRQQQPHIETGNVTMETNLFSLSRTADDSLSAVKS